MKKNEKKRVFELEEMYFLYCSFLGGLLALKIKDDW